MFRHFGKLFFVLCVAAGTPAVAETHPFNWDDLYSMIRLGDPQPSPDGRSVLLTRTEFNVEANKGNTDVMVVASDTKAVRRLTTDAASDSNGRWLPDGNAVLFLSNRGGSAQLFKLSLEGGEAEKVSDLPIDIDGFELSPDGKKVLFWAGVYPDCKDLDCTAKRMKEAGETKMKAKTFDRLFIRHWNEWNDGRRNHLFVMGLDDRKPIDLMAGMDQDAPTKPYGGSNEVSWSPDGKTIAFTSKPAEGEAWKTNSEIYLVPADGSTPPKDVTSENLAVDRGPAFSPDGVTLAYVAMDRPGYEADREHIVLMNLTTGSKRTLAKDWDRSVDEIVWANDGTTLYATALETGRTKVWTIDMATGKLKPIVEEGTNTDVRVAKGGKLFFLREKLTQPKELFVLDRAMGVSEAITSINADRLAQIQFGTPEDFWFQNEKLKIRGWVIKPADFKSGQTYPVAFMIHGGPQGSFANDIFHYRWNQQILAGAGYAVVTVDFRGSTGYGQAFTDAIRGNWGPGPFSDLMAGLKEALKKFPFLDATRMCALGGSYGGYMVNWIEGQENPFKCLVNHDGDFDTVSSYYNTEELWFPEWDMTGTPWEKPDVYAKNSPMKNVGKWKTPMLVIHGGKDFRVVDSEGISTFNALQRRSIPSKLIYFPEAGHWIQKPQDSRYWYKSVLEWIGQWTAPVK